MKPRPTSAKTKQYSHAIRIVIGLIVIGAAFVIGRASSRLFPSGGVDDVGTHQGDRGGADQATNPLGDRLSGRSKSDRNGAIQKSRLTPEQLSARVASIMSMPDAADRVEAWARFLKKLDPDQMESATSIFRGQEFSMYSKTEYTMLLTAWAACDPSGAMDFLMQNRGQSYAYETVLTKWAMDDSDAVLGWIGKLDDRRQADMMQLGVIKILAVSDPVLASQLLVGMSASPDTNRCINALAANYAKSDPHGARRWATDIVDPWQRRIAISAVTENLVGDFDDTLKWLGTHPAEESSEAIREMMHQLTGNDPKTAIARFNQISDPLLKRSALEGMAGSLPLHGQAEAYLELVGANPGLVGDDTHLDFVSSCLMNANEVLYVPAIEAVQWIKDPELRMDRYATVLSNWSLDDADGAENWINQHRDRLSDEDVELIRAKIAENQVEKNQ